MSAHTPWIVSGDDDSDFFIVGPDSGNGLVCSPIFRTHDEKLAHLIAAAPELLEALQETDKDLTVLLSNICAAQKRDPKWGGMWELVFGWRERNRAAIAKATGAAA